MTRGIWIIAVAGILAATGTGTAHAVPALSMENAPAHSLVSKAGWKYCYWKRKNNGKWKYKCDH